MSRQFGEYLVDQGLITENELAEAFIEQLYRQPLAADLLFRNKMITARQLIDSLLLQSTDGGTFLEAVVRCADLPSDRVEHYQSIKNEASPTLGQILLGNDVLNAEQISKALDGFVAKNEGVVKQEIASIPEDRIESSSEGGGSSESISDLVGEFLSLFDQDQCGFIEDPERLLADAGEVEGVLDFLRMLSAGAQFVEATLMEKVINTTISGLKAESLSSVRIVAGVALIKALKRELEQTGSEQGFWKDTSNQQTYVNYINDVSKQRG